MSVRVKLTKTVGVHLHLASLMRWHNRGMDSAVPDCLPTRTRLIAFGPEAVEQVGSPTIPQLVEAYQKWPVVWLDIVGQPDEELENHLIEQCGIHRLALEDALSPNQRPKMEEFEKSLVVVLKMAERSTSNGRYLETLGLLLTQDAVITIQPTPEDILEPVRTKLMSGEGRLRNRLADYLAYQILDSVVHGYFPVIEEIGDELEDLEDLIVAKPDQNAMRQVHELRRELLAIRRATWPAREALFALTRGETKLIQPDTEPYFRDCYDHIIQVIDVVETYRELCSDLADLYLSSISNRMNEIMKVLTVMSSVFIPLTFIAGVYGMNFSKEAGALSMPELYQPWGYVACVAVMLLVGVGQLWIFWSKGWIGKK